MLTRFCVRFDIVDQRGPTGFLPMGHITKNVITCGPLNKSMYKTTNLQDFKLNK